MKVALQATFCTSEVKLFVFLGLRLIVARSFTEAFFLIQIETWLDVFSVVVDGFKTVMLGLRNGFFFRKCQREAGPVAKTELSANRYVN